MKTDLKTDGNNRQSSTQSGRAVGLAGREKDNNNKMNINMMKKRGKDGKHCP